MTLWSVTGPAPMRAGSIEVAVAAMAPASLLLSVDASGAAPPAAPPPAPVVASPDPSPLVAASAPPAPGAPVVFEPSLVTNQGRSSSISAYSDRLRNVVDPSVCQDWSPAAVGATTLACTTLRGRLALLGLTSPT